MLVLFSTVLLQMSGCLDGYGFLLILRSKKSELFITYSSTGMGLNRDLFQVKKESVFQE